MAVQLQDLVSVITPSYNAAALIGKTIESVLNQTYINWEMIIVDDFSKDSTCDVVAEYVKNDPRIRLVKLDRNHGAPAAPRNIGVTLANGRWIALLDADDIWHPRKLELQLKALYQTNSSFCCSQMLDFHDDKLINFNDTKNFDLEYISFKMQRIKGRIPTSSVLVSKDLLVAYPFNEDIRYRAVEDYHCWLRIHQATGESIKIKYPLLMYRRIVGQISGSKKYMLQRMYMLHREYPGSGIISSMFFTLSHAIGGFYYRIVRRGL